MDKRLRVDWSGKIFQIPPVSCLRAVKEPARLAAGRGRLPADLPPLASCPRARHHSSTLCPPPPAAISEHKPAIPALRIERKKGFEPSLVDAIQALAEAIR